MSKPLEILELEKKVNIFLSESENLYENNSYKLDENKNVVGLNLNSNDINDISFLYDLKYITVLSLNNNKISDISPLKKLFDLKILYLNSNQISDISFIKNLKKIKILRLNDNQISDISSLESFTALTNLSISNNKISNISSLEKLFLLESLNLSSNQILDISPIEKLKSLNELTLNTNIISDVSFLKDLTSLSLLDLGFNKIINISILENLTDITNLSLSFNYIQDGTSINKLKKIKSLYLSSNLITDYSFIKDLTNLSTLFLGSNNISDINFLKNLKKINFLYLSYNKISDLTILKNLSNISNLILKHNNISDLSVFDSIKSINEIELSDNKVIDVEQFKFIFNNPKLIIKASNNPCFEKNIIEVDKNNYDTILNILKKNNEDKQEYILPTKVLLLGNSGSGKSTLLDYVLQEAPRKLKEKIDSTHIVQIEIFPKKIKKNQLPQAVFYDFGGQDYYHGLYKAFLSSNSLNVLLWNSDYDKNQIRKDRNNLMTRDYDRNYWLYQLKFQYSKTKVNANSKNTTEPILLVQTLADKQDHRREVYKGNSSFFNIKNEFFISLNQKAIIESKTLEIGLNYFEETLKEQIKLNQIVKKEPIWYKEFLNYILKSKKVTFTTLSELKNEYKRDSDPNNFLLPEVLREIAQTGLILYYKDDDDLKDVVWLNSSKTIQSIHKSILSHKNIIEKKGIINKDDFEKLVDQKLTKLLLNQKVIFLDSFDNRYIIPGYLPLTEEDEKLYELLTFDFIEPNFVIKFEYFIPLGLINQLICFYGQNKNKKYFWRDQLLFTEEDSKILIKLDFTNLEIIVSIKSNSAKKIEKIEKKIFKDILDLYWDKKSQSSIIESDLKKEEINVENLINEAQKSNLQNDIFDESLISPEDLYISIDNKYFLHHKTLENKEITANKIISFSIKITKEIQNGKEIELKKIDKTRLNEQASGLYKNFTTNNNAKNMKKIFISYAKENKKEVNEFQKQITPFKLTKEVETWHCSELELGEDWDAKIKSKFYEADIILYFISTDFFSTPYILDEEVKRGIERDLDPDDNVVLIPIILEKIHWQDLLGKYTSNFKGIPISLYDKPNEAWYEVVDDLKTNHFRISDTNSTSSILGQSKEKMKSQENILKKL